MDGSAMPPQDWRSFEGPPLKKRREEKGFKGFQLKALVTLDSDSEEEKKAFPKQSFKPPPHVGKTVIELCSSDEEDEKKATAHPFPRLPTLSETHATKGLHASWQSESGAFPGGGRESPQAFRSQKAAAWSPPRPQMSDEPSASLKRTERGPKPVSKEEKGKQKVDAWSEDEEGDSGRQFQFEASGDESDDSLDLLNLRKPAARKAPLKPKQVPARETEKVHADFQKKQGAHFESEVGAEVFENGAGSFENETDEELEGLDEREKKRRLAERKKREAAQAKAAKAEERARKKEEQRLEKERQKTERQEARKQAAEEKKAAKEAERQQRVQHKDNYQKLTGKNALASCCVQIDPSLIGKDRLGMDLTLELQSKGYKYECAANPMKDSITWRRIHYSSRVGTEDEFGSQSHSQRLSQSQPISQVEGELVDVPYVVLAYSAATFCEMVRSQALWRKLEEANTAHPGWTVCLLIPELRKYIKQRKAEDYKKASLPGHVPWQDPGVEEALAKLCIEYDRVRSCVTKDDQEAAEHVANLTRGHAEAPYKKESTVVGTFGGGNHLKPADKARLRKWPWLKGLTLLEGVSINVAEAIKQRYPTLRSLMDAYHDPMLTPQQKAGLLKDIPRTIGFGEGSQPGQETTRRVGPKLSEKIHAFLTAREAGTMIEEDQD